MERIYEGMSLRDITEFLFLEDEPEPSDLIFVFGGRHHERGERAAELYLKGMAPLVFITGGDKRAVGVPEALTLREAAIAAGVPEERILVETRAGNTVENVAFGLKFLEDRGLLGTLKSVILVSAPVHMRRAKLVFQSHFPAYVRILCCPDRRKDVNRTNWWQSEEGRRIVFRELEKVRNWARSGRL